MAAILKWKQPKAAVDRDVRRNLDLAKSMARRYVIWWVLLGGAALYIVYRLAPDMVLRVMLQMIVGALIFPAYIIALTVLSIKFDAAFRIDERGLMRLGGRSFQYNWQDVKGYAIRDDPELLGVRILKFKTRRSSKWRKWCYDPSEVDESTLRAILEEHLPGKCWDTTPQ